MATASGSRPVRSTCACERPGAMYTTTDADFSVTLNTSRENAGTVSFDCRQMSLTVFCTGTYEAMMPEFAPDIFRYLDFRAWLGDYYTAAKANDRRFSYRYFARRAGYSSPNFLKLVIDGQRNLSPDSVERFADALKLDDAERRFFADLVAFGQAADDAERNEAFERVAASRRFRRARRIDHQYHRYLSVWHYPVIREMVARDDFDEDPFWIAEQLVPRVPVPRVREALELLYDLGLLVRDDDGRLRQAEPTLTTGHEVRSLAAGNYHRQMMERAADAIEIVPRAHRDLGALTMCVTPQTAQVMKHRLHQFLETMLELADSDEDGQVVYQLNFQFFPLTAFPELDE